MIKQSTETFKGEKAKYRIVSIGENHQIQFLQTEKEGWFWNRKTIERWHGVDIAGIFWHNSLEDAEKTLEIFFSPTVHIDKKINYYYGTK